MMQMSTKEMNVAATTTIDATTTSTGQTLPLPSTKVKLNPQDVLLGRGDWTVRYEGNVRFRDLIREKRDLFGAASGRSARDLVASDVIRIITERGGRFLRKESDVTDCNDALSSQQDSETKQDASPIDGTWIIVDKKTAMKKVKQAFRDKDSWTQKVDANGPQPPAASFTSASSLRNDANLSLPTLPGVMPSLMNNVNFQQQQSLLQNNAAMTESLHRLEFERTLMAAVQQQQQQQQRNLSIDVNNRLRQLSALGAAGGSSSNASVNLGLGMLTPIQQQQLLSAASATASRQQFQPTTTSSAIDGTNLSNSSSSLLQQQLFLLQQQQQQKMQQQQQQQRVEMALRESMLLQQRSRQQQDVLGQLASPATSLQLGSNDWLSGNTSNQGLSLQQQLRLAQLQQQQQQLNALGLSAFGGGLTHTGMGQNMSLPVTLNSSLQPGAQDLVSSPALLPTSTPSNQQPQQAVGALSGHSKQSSTDNERRIKENSITKDVNKYVKRDAAAIMNEEVDEPADDNESLANDDDSDEEESEKKITLKNKAKKRKVVTKSKQSRRKSLK